MTLTECEREIEARAKAASQRELYTTLGDVFSRPDRERIAHFMHPLDSRADAEFFVRAREDIPYLLAQLREARGKLEAVREWRRRLGRIEDLDRILHPQEAE